MLTILMSSCSRCVVKDRFIQIGSFILPFEYIIIKNYYTTFIITFIKWQISYYNKIIVLTLIIYIIFKMRYLRDRLSNL